jgi:NAD(P)-dependent dehydrogenase (short-subunit alcohol dehydrogenase family)
MNVSYDFSGKVIVVAGGAGGLGASVVDLFVESGATVIAPDRVVPENGGGNPGCDYLMLDALSETSVADVLNEVAVKHGQIDALVNVIGGYAAGDPVSALDLSVYEKQLDLNLKSALLLTKYAVQTMSERGGGKIVHIASRAAVDKGANSFPYSVSKLGVVRLVEAVAAETRNEAININAVMPSIIDTPANRKAMPDAKYDNWPKPAQIANVIAFLCSDAAELISGAAVPVYGRA